MNRSELIITTTIVLLVAFLFGWFSRWLVTRFTRIGMADMSEVDKLAQALSDAEEARDEAIAWFHDREQTLQGRLTQTEAELRAAMDGLREARAEGERLRAYVEKMHAE